VPLTVNNQGVLAGGGGGGARYGCEQCNRSGTGGAGLVSGGGGGAGSGLYLRGNVITPDTVRSVTAFDNAKWDTAGAGINGGAKGGEWGVEGGVSACGAPGGLPGNAVYGVSNITWTNQGVLIGPVK
jgi:hypothetical protein